MVVRPAGGNLTEAVAVELETVVFAGDAAEIADSVSCEVGMVDFFVAGILMQGGCDVAPDYGTLSGGGLDGQPAFPVTVYRYAFADAVFSFVKDDFGIMRRCCCKRYGFA